MVKTAKVFPWNGDGPGDPIVYKDVDDVDTAEAGFTIYHGDGEQAIWPIDSVHHIDTMGLTE